MIRVKKYRHLLHALTGIFALLIFLITTTPEQIALGFLVIPILVIVFITYELVRFGISVFSNKKETKKQQAVSAITAIATGLLLMLQSIGQLSAGDLAIVVFFVLISVFYINRFR